MSAYLQNMTVDSTGMVSYEIKCDDLVFRPDVITAPVLKKDELAAWLGLKPRKLEVTDVMTNGPATIAFFNDKSKSVVVTHEGDKYSERFGLLAALLRKAKRNRRWDHLEKLVKRLSKVDSTKDMRALGNMLIMAADWLERDDH